MVSPCMWLERGSFTAIREPISDVANTAIDKFRMTGNTELSWKWVEMSVLPTNRPQQEGTVVFGSVLGESGGRDAKQRGGDA